ADRITDAASVGAQMAHDSEAAHTTPCIPAQIEHQPATGQVSDRPPYVSGDIHSKDTRKHADSDQADVVVQLCGSHNLIGHDDRTLLLLRSWNNECRFRCRTISSPYGERVRLSKRECCRFGGRKLPIAYGEENVAGP